MILEPQQEGPIKTPRHRERRAANEPARGTETGRVPGAPEIRRATARTAARFRSDLRRLFARANNRPTRTRSSTKLSRARISRGISLIRGGIRLE